MVWNLQALVCIESGEKLTENAVRNTLHLHGHCHTLSANVEGKDLASVDPYCCTPGRLVEKGEQEGQECDSNADGLCFTAIGFVGCGEAHDGNKHSTQRHTTGANHEQDPATETINSPYGVKSD